jgi:putative acetyltransferase
MAIQLQRTDSDNPDFRKLVALLDAYLALMDGDEHAFYHQYNHVDMLRQVIVAYIDGKPAGCGAIKPYSDSEMEIKRMYVLPEFRGKGIAKNILAALENWATELGFSACILETGKRQTEAVSLYPKCGYEIIPNYGQYIAMDNSVCMKKQLV